MIKPGYAAVYDITQGGVYTVDGLSAFPQSVNISFSAESIAPPFPPDPLIRTLSINLQWPLLILSHQ
jgi:hypothetical protein